MQLNILNIKPVLVRYQRPLDEKHKFGWSDANPFTKEAWKGNLKEANQGFLSSWKSFGNNVKSIGKMALDDFQEEKKKHGLLGAVARSAWKMNPIGMMFNPKNTLKYAGALSRAGMNALGGTVGYAGLLVIPQNLEKKIAENADLIDPTQLLTFAISLGDAAIHLDRSRIIAPGQENGGFTNDRYWSWLGDKKMRQDLNDTANFAAALYGIKGLKSGIKGMARGKGVAGVLNLRSAKDALKGTKNAFNDVRNGQYWSATKNAVKAGLEGWGASDPALAAYVNPFTRNIINSNNAYFNMNKNQFKEIIL